VVLCYKAQERRILWVITLLARLLALLVASEGFVVVILIPGKICASPSFVLSYAAVDFHPENCVQLGRLSRVGRCGGGCARSERALDLNHQENRTNENYS
jgi:hypothetical protein